MNRQIKHLLFLFQLICTGSLCAQESTNSAGGQAIGLNGNCYFSLGQSFIFEQGNTTTIQPGVQQVYANGTVTQLNKSHHNQITIIPNPSTERIRVQNAGLVILKWQIHNSLGQLVDQGEFLNSDKTILVNQYANGIYYLTISSKEEIHTTQMFIKQSNE